MTTRPGGAEAGEGASTAERLYANSLTVRFSLSEVELVFGQRFGAGEALCRSWLVTSPVHLVTFGRLIDAAIARYQSRFGPIPDARNEPES
jgi:hypothetical protein